MNARTAGLLLRLPFGPGFGQAADTALHAADAGAPAAVPALAHALRSRRHTVVWQAWLDLSTASARRWATPLLTELLDGRPKIPDLLVDAAWADWLGEHDDRLWSLLEGWGRAASGRGRRVRSLSRLALGEDRALNPRLLVATATRFDHPIGERARAHLLRVADQESVDLFCAAGMNSPDVATFCVERDLTPSDVVVNAAWRDWLDEPGGTRWSLLRHWNRPAMGDPPLHSLSRLALGEDGAPADASVLAETAARFDHPIGERARARLAAGCDTEAVDLFCAAALDSPDAVAFCVADHLAPSDDVQRAVFFVRTEQHEQYRALDPDGALLALGYRSASSQVRESLRAAMAAAGGIDTLRVLAGQRAGADLAALSKRERAYLFQHLTDQGGRERLWSLTARLPLPEVVEAAHAFGDWRPARAGARAVFEALLAADPDAVHAQVKTLSAASLNWGTLHTQINLADLDRRLTSVFDLDFAPDGGQLAFANISGRAGIIDIADRSLARLYSALEDPAIAVAHLGSDAIVVAESGDNMYGLKPSGRSQIHYVDRDGGRKVPVEADISHIRALRRIGGGRGYVALSVLGHGPDRRFTVLVGAAADPLRDGGVFEAPHRVNPQVAVGPGGRLIAVVGDRGGVVADLAGPAVNVLAGGTALATGGVPKLALSPSILIHGNHEGDVRIWREPRTSTEAPVSMRLLPSGRSLVDLAWSTALNRFLAIVQARSGTYRSYLEVLGLRATGDQPMPEAVVSDSVTLGVNMEPVELMRLSPNGDVLALTGGAKPIIDLYAFPALTLRPFIDKPIGEMTPANLADVTVVLKNPALDSRSRQTIALLRACLEYRFRDDIGLAAAEAVVAEDDIELGG